MAEEATKTSSAPSQADAAATTETNNAAPIPPLERRISSSQQPLRHGRKPIYPDSDAEAEGLDADVDDEELETGLAPGQGDHERSSLLGGSTRNSQGGANAIGPLDRAWLNIAKLWGGDKAYSARLMRRRKQRRNTGAASASRRNSRSIHASSEASFAAWRHEHPFIMRSLYTVAALLLIVLTLIVVAASHLYVATLKSPSPETQSRILDESLLLKGPDRVQLLNISDDGILVRVDARLGLDPDHALDLWLGKRGKQGWWKNKERKLVEWAMGKVAGVQVDVGEVRLSEIGAAWEQELLLPPASLALAESDPRDMLGFHLDPLVLPLPPLNRKIDGGDKGSKDALRPPILGNHSTPAAQHNMSPLNLTVLLKPVVPAPYIMDYAQHAIKKGFAQLDVKVASLRVRGLAKSEIRGINHGRKAGFFDVPRRINIAQQRIRSPVREKVPKLDNDTNPDDLLKVDGYEFFEIGNDGDDDDGDHKDSFWSSMVMRALGIKATAQAMNPLGKVLQGNVRYSLPFGIYLPVDAASTPAPPKHPKNGTSHATESSPGDDTDASVLMAAVATEPFQLTGQKVVEVELLGRVVPPPQDDGDMQVSQLKGGEYVEADQAASQKGVAISSKSGGDSPQQVALSNFLSRFLRGENNTVYVRGGSPLRDASAKAIDELPGDGSDLPDWMDSALRLVDLPISFPGAKVTELIKNVTINDLKITPHPFEKDKLLCSGTVMGEINMPGQLSSIDVKITHMWPDILVYDGLPPSMRKSVEVAPTRFDLVDGALNSLKRLAFLGESDGDAVTSQADPKKPEPEPAPPLPDPLPEKAFGRVRPYDFAPAETLVDPTDPRGERKLLRAVLKDVPFTVLPGRGPIFRSFTWRLVTGQGALVGIEGASRAKIWNSGLGALQLRNLPVKGAFMLGKRD
ncbi:uncharacterized protein SRS1_12184 [Sporisorium reilianum f. sp. reilianum]|uniref:Uncharacterized protein n=1 Tax=Sporisorium reilianum f. sp. reilianum TaxID=72559 RepID=A0A2N8U864_9BASI|nr:uncharacterized protein SRS1_12184 [Sporisorium reilianum f. sp. reilianum]